MKTKAVFFAEYEAIHRHPKNKLTHYAGIPLIVIAVLGLLGHVILSEPAWLFNAGFAVWLPSALFYIRLDAKAGACFAAVLLAMLAVGRGLPPAVLVAAFIVGWILQLFGHYAYEKKSPAFLDNLLHLLIGPFWIFARLGSGRG